MAKEVVEEIGLLTKDSPSGKKVWPVLEVNGETLLLQGEFGTFESTVYKAIRNGYRLISADDHLRGAWAKVNRRIEEQIAKEKEAEALLSSEEAV